MENKPTLKQLETFLKEVDASFPVPLSQKQELGAFAKKLFEKGTLCAILEEGRILSLAAGYTRDVVNEMGYISVVATLREAYGRGLASQLVTAFLDQARACGLKAVHLYTAASNAGALRMYQKIGFEIWHPAGEQRPEDVHLIYRFLREEKEESL